MTKKNLNDRKPWFKNRGYLHLTNRINISSKGKVEQYVSNVKLVAKHRFTPLILRETKVRRYKYSNDIKRHSHKAINDKGNYVSNKKIRPIMYSTHIDAHIYSYYAHEIIQPLYEKQLKSDIHLNNCVTAYRRIKNEDGNRFKYNVDFAKEVFDEIKKRKDCVALAFDISDFFPSLDHKQLKRIWSNLLKTKSLPKDHYNIYKSITNYSYFFYDDLRVGYKGNLDEKKISKLRNKGKFQLFEDYRDFKRSGIQVFKNEPKKGKIRKGIPQGLPISALLANLYMLPFDQSIVKNLVVKNNCYYRRYSDDLVIICNTSQYKEVEKIVNSEIKKLKLIISPSKTDKYNFHTINNRLECFKILQNESLVPNSYLQYLGFEFYGYKTLIKSANISRFYREMKQSIAMKAKRIKQIQDKNLTDETIIFKRKIYRLYSFKGINSRKLPATQIQNKDDKLIVHRFERQYRGNFIKYVYRASYIMEASEIRRQIRRHMIILKKHMRNYEFDNTD